VSGTGVAIPESKLELLFPGAMLEDFVHGLEMAGHVLKRARLL
jgi:hypothetical protein